MNTNDVVVLEEGARADEPVGWLDTQPNTDFGQGLNENRSVPMDVSNTRLENQNVVEKRENPIEVKIKEEENQKPNTENTKDEEVRKNGERESSKPCHSTTSMTGNLPHSVRKIEKQEKVKQNRERIVPVRFTDSEYVQIREESGLFHLSLSELIRRHTLRRKMPTPAVSGLQKETYIELSRIGNNLNQVVKLIHERRLYQVPIDLLNELVSTVKRIGLQLAGSR